MGSSSIMSSIAMMAATAQHMGVGAVTGNQPIGNKCMDKERKRKLKQQKASRKKNRRG